MNNIKQDVAKNPLALFDNPLGELEYFKESGQDVPTARSLLTNALTNKKEAREYYKHNAFDYWEDKSIVWDATPNKGLRRVHGILGQGVAQINSEITAMAQSLKMTLLNDVDVIEQIDKTARGESWDKLEGAKDSEEFLNALDALSLFQYDFGSFSTVKQTSKREDRDQKEQASPAEYVGNRKDYVKQMISCAENIDDYLNHFISDEIQDLATGLDNAFSYMPYEYKGRLANDTKYCFAVTEIKNALQILSGLLEVCNDNSPFASDEILKAPF